MLNNDSDKLKLILVNPLFDEAIQGEHRGFQLGLLYISTYVQSHGYNSKILVGEGVTSKICRELDLCHDKNYPLVGFYVSADNVQEVERSCLSIKNKYPAIQIILGGPEARIEPDKYLRAGIANYVCTGDGEDCTLELLKKINSKKGSLNNIPHLKYMSDNKVYESGNTKIRYNLDNYPIPKREMYDPRFLYTGHIATARGCASECTFCFEGLDKKIRRHSPERTVEEIKYLNKRFGTTYFSFVDDTFTTDKRKVYKLCNLIDINFPKKDEIIWYCEAKVSDLSLDKKLFGRMVQSGLERMQFGTESGNQHILDSYKKEITIDQIYECVEQSKKTNITSMFTNVIIGGVHETQETFKNTLEMCKDLIKLNPGVVEVASTFLSPYTGTDIRNNPDKYGVDILEYDFTTSSSDSYIFAKSKKMSKEEVLELGKHFFNETYNTMINLIPDLSHDQIKKQLTISKHGLSTNWYEILSKDKTFYSWLMMKRRGYLDKIPLNINHFLIIPSRTIDIEKMSEKLFIWQMRRLKIEFSSFEFFLIEKAAGKISLQAIIDESYNVFWKRTVSKTKLRDDIVRFYNNLADNFLMCFREFY